MSDLETLVTHIKKNRFMPTPPADRIFTGGDDSNYIQVGTDILRSLFWLAKAEPTSKILEVGSGIGRGAVPLTQYLSPEGRYTGTDIVAHGVNWCSETITPKYPNFEFVHYDIYNEFYNPDGKGTVQETPLPEIEGGYDIVFLASVFTHLNREDVETYLPRMAAALKPGGRLWGSWFSIDKGVGDSILDGRAKIPLLPKEDDGVYYSAENKGTGAVAFDEDMICSMLDAAGFDVLHIQRGEWFSPRVVVDGGFQDVIVGIKR
ncbi:class I SAM-dependent methyltransferase [Agrobacterium rosae]|uniref:Methyltransferase domain protein n=1 Tax=Agrobacterium rosae TaxID=1972867 RepID=A0A1R3T8W5_9HYPH|nr:class I SAM-dependent methyltransferase [Agrobacterium rosae]SCX02686.1 Methyltransferase domain protein [Agrobacterium rosae]